MGYNHAYCRSEGKTKRLVVADYHLNEKKVSVLRHLPYDVLHGAAGPDRGSHY